jgi:ABC-2 type transport system permease protein
MTMTMERATKPAKGGGLPGAIAFEWTKLTTVRATWWNLIIGAVMSLGFGLILGLSAEASAAKGIDVTMPAPHAASQGFILIQLTMVVLATLALTSEYASGSMRSTLQSVPVRGRMLFAKSVVVVAVVAVASLVYSIMSSLVAAVFMGDYGKYTGGELLATALGAAAYLSAIALIAIGLGTMLRSAAGTITTIIMILLALPQLMQVIGAKWLATASDYMPSVAGSVLMTQNDEPYRSGTALLVLVLWSLAMVIGGYVTLRKRDA